MRTCKLDTGHNVSLKLAFRAFMVDVEVSSNHLIVFLRIPCIQNHKYKLHSQGGCWMIDNQHSVLNY